jgi:hypothetical protein
MAHMCKIEQNDQPGSLRKPEADFRAPIPMCFMLPQQIEHHDSEKCGVKAIKFDSKDPSEKGPSQQCVLVHNPI